MVYGLTPETTGMFSLIAVCVCALIAALAEASTFWSAIVLVCPFRERVECAKLGRAELFYWHATLVVFLQRCLA
jgi:hypothetical protein